MTRCGNEAPTSSRAQDVGEELRELVGAGRVRRDGGGETVVPAALCDERVLVPHRPDARRRRGDDGVVLVERSREVPYQRNGLVHVARVDHGLGAAGLGGGNLDINAQTLEKADRRNERLRVERVVEACRHEGYAHARTRRPSARASGHRVINI